MDHPPTRVTAFIDASNLFHAQKQNGWRIDFAKLGNYIDSHGECRGKYYFTPTPASHNQPAMGGYQKFKKMLIINGFTVKDKEVKEIKARDAQGNIITKLKGNLDLEMGHWMTRVYPHYDTAIIMAGDSDYAPIIEDMILNGKYVIIISNKNNTALEVQNLAQKFIDLNHIRKDTEFQREIPQP